MTILCAIAILLVFHFLVTSVATFLTARRLKIAKLTFRRALLTALVLLGIRFLSAVGMAWSDLMLANTFSYAILNALAVAVFAIELMLYWIFIQRLMRTSHRQAGVIWLSAIAAQFVTFGLIFLVIHPFVFEAFAVSTNSMAPTIAGWHYAAACPNCQGELVVLAANPHQQRRKSEESKEEIGICTSASRRRWSAQKTCRSAPRIESPSINAVHRADGICWCSSIQKTPTRSTYNGSWVCRAKRFTFGTEQFGLTTCEQTSPAS